jgi:hypothetical protein
MVSLRAWEATDAQRFWQLGEDQGTRTSVAKVSADWAFRRPTTGIEGCCARAATGHATAPPRSVMNARRFMLISPLG